MYFHLCRTYSSRRNLSKDDNYLKRIDCCLNWKLVTTHDTEHDHMLNVEVTGSALRMYERATGTTLPWAFFLVLESRNSLRVNFALMSVLYVCGNKDHKQN